MSRDLCSTERAGCGGREEAAQRDASDWAPVSGPKKSSRTHRCVYGFEQLNRVLLRNKEREIKCSENYDDGDIQGLI